MTTEIRIRAAEIYLRAERAMGLILKQTPMNPGAKGQGRPRIGGAKTEPPKSDTPTLAESGIGGIA
jgi:hypothetical protein